MLIRSLFVAFALFPAYFAYADFEAKCHEKGGRVSESVCLCPDGSSIDPFLQSCAESAANAEIVGAVRAVTDWNSEILAVFSSYLPCKDYVKPRWNPTLWEERNARLIHLREDQNDFHTTLAQFDGLPDQMWYYSDPFGPETSSYDMDYVAKDEHLSTTVTIKGVSAIPPFRIQYLMLVNLANQRKKNISIKKITRDNITNSETKEALRADFGEFESGERVRESDFESMEFFKAPNGRNTLDIIRKISGRNPFSLIEKVIVHSNNATVFLREPIVVHPSL